MAKLNLLHNKMYIEGRSIRKTVISALGEVHVLRADIMYFKRSDNWHCTLLNIKTLKSTKRNNNNDFTLLYMYITDLPTIPDFPGQYRKYKLCPGVQKFCLKIQDFDGPGYCVKYLCATCKCDRPDHVNCV